jgi:hypothetical protein
MTAEKIIEKFELQVDDSTELSSEEELDLLNKVYLKVCGDRPWEFLKTEFSSVTNGTDNVDLPTNFSYFVEMDEDMRKLVWVGGSKYYLIKYSDRRFYNGRTDVCYVNIGSNKLYFMVAPSSGLSVSADYIKVPDLLTLSDSPIFPENYQHALYYLMAVDDFVIQQGNKNESYAPENQNKADSYLKDMRYWNAILTNE